ncbi:MAG: hypothetical protein R2712_10245 [Vicinamibacterales bacterium]
MSEFARLPDIDGVAARMMNLVDETTTRRLFVNDMRGPLYSVSYDGASVALYVDTNASAWGHPVQSSGRERGFQSFTFHPQFGRAGAPGYGRFYTFTDTSNMTPEPDFLPAGGDKPTHDTVLLEWTAKDPSAATYDGGPPRVLFRIRQPFANHNAGHLAFDPTAAAGSTEAGLLLITIADGGSGGDPFNMAQNLGSAFGKMFRIDPLGTNGHATQCGIPSDNPFVARAGALPKSMPTASATPALRVGREDAKPLPRRHRPEHRREGDAGAEGRQPRLERLGGLVQFVGRQAVEAEGRRGDPAVTFPFAEYGQLDPLLQPQSAACGLVIYRGTAIPQVANRVLFTDNPSGEMFYVSADDLPEGGQDPIRRVLVRTPAGDRTFLQVIQETNAAQGKTPATRADLRLNAALDDQILMINKGDGVIRRMVR